jgi:hypothetical protein
MILRRNRSNTKILGIGFIAGGLLLAIFASIAAFRYRFFIEVYVPIYFLLFIGIIVGIATLTLSSGIIIFRTHKVHWFAVPALGLIMIFLMGIPMFGFYYIETNYIKGESNLRKLAALYNSQEDWETRATIIRRGILQNAELDPFPDRTPLNVTCHSLRTYVNYSVENVYFESLPGFFVTGNLYKPVGDHWPKPFPIIMIPHGHFQNGRFAFEMQQLGATFARMGAIVMTYDMVGRGESTQIPHEASHVLMFQLWNNIRILDFLLSLNDTDPSRVGITGASGGGTQAIFLTAVDNRVKLSAPVLMVSSWMYGGCSCEQGMPVHRGQDYATNNAEIAAMAAPRSQLFVSSNTDWTRFMPTVDFPYIRRIYSFYGKENFTQNVHILDEKHDFGLSKRIAVYSFISYHFSLQKEAVITDLGIFNESANVMETENNMHAFTPIYPRPFWALQGEEAIISEIHRQQHIDPVDDAPNLIDGYPLLWIIGTFAICMIQMRKLYSNSSYTFTRIKL